MPIQVMELKISLCVVKIFKDKRKELYLGSGLRRYCDEAKILLENYASKESVIYLT